MPRLSDALSGATSYLLDTLLWAAIFIWNYRILAIIIPAPEAFHIHVIYSIYARTYLRIDRRSILYGGPEVHTRLSWAQLDSTEPQLSSARPQLDSLISSTQRSSARLSWAHSAPARLNGAQLDSAELSSTQLSPAQFNLEIQLRLGLVCTCVRVDWASIIISCLPIQNIVYPILTCLETHVSFLSFL